MVEVKLWVRKKDKNTRQGKTTRGMGGQTMRKEAEKGRKKHEREKRERRMTKEDKNVKEKRYR